MTEIIQCNCESEFQDQLYGKGMRLMNIGGKDKPDSYHCTVCGRVLRISEGKKKTN